MSPSKYSSVLKRGITIEKDRKNRENDSETIKKPRPLRGLTRLGLTTHHYAIMSVIVTLTSVPLIDA